MPNIQPLRLGVNVDHVATLRNARAIDKPDPVRAALLAIEAGADDDDEVEDDAAKALFARLDRIVIEAEYAEL